MASPKWWHVRVYLFGQSYQLDTIDTAKIGPWLCDIVNAIEFHPGQAAPVDLQVSIQ